MASPDKRKICKAKKTMTASCQKQVHLLNKSKNIEALEIAAVGNNVSSTKENSKSCVINSKHEQSEKVSSMSSDKNSVFSQNIIKQLENVYIGPRLGYTEKQAVYPNQKSSKAVDFPFLLIPQKAKYSQAVSENHCEFHTEATRSFCDHEEKNDNKVKSVYPPSIALNGEAKIPKSTVTDSSDGKRIIKMISCLEKDSNSEPPGKSQCNLNPNTHFVPIDKIPKLASPVVFNNSAADTAKSEEPSRTCYPSIINSKYLDTTVRLSSLDTDSNNSHNQEKRVFPNHNENVKRMKISEQINENICVNQEKKTALLEKVRHLVRQEISSVNCTVFDNKLKELTERMEKIQLSNNKQEARAGELFVTNSETMNLDRIEESLKTPDERKTSVTNESCHSSVKASEKIDLSRDHVKAISESNNDVILIPAENPNLTSSLTSNTTGSEKIISRISNHLPCAESEATPIKKTLDSVIDLTTESLSMCDNKENLVSAMESFAETASSSKETSLLSLNTTQVPESFAHLPHLPEPLPPLPELVDKIRDTLPPQKSELRVKRVLRPHGIALTWNITKINPKCAPVESYHLFLCYENSNKKLTWKKIGEIKALPLPMACTLSQFLVSNKYYFAIQSKDIFGRYGPFSDIKSLPGLSENLT
ncbi:activating transcription factor 7-interacting protein 2 [Suncus etruscus]|uniref:activating transcription factor 7-interacting protein 2 n=1 Tax=Suncus etruscus TaxID=109475 RepID=UPI00210F950F|nr:activating transcription factor 7-interacting protein 2 [Suncus etruscus]